MNITKEQQMSYTEVCEILKHMNQNDVDKIPKEILNYYITNSDKNYDFKIDENKSFNDLNISYNAKVVLAILFRDYWATQEQRNKILQKEKNDLQLEEEKKRKIYNPNSIFKNDDNTQNEITNANNQSNNSNSLIEYKEKWYTKILTKLKELFNKKQ